MSWAKDFCECVAEELALALSSGNAKDQVRHLAFAHYAALWNAVIVTDRQKTTISFDDARLSLDCRLTALKLLGLANREASLLVDKTCAAVSKAEIMVKSIPEVKEMGFSFVETVVTNAVKVLCMNSPAVGDLPEISKGICELVMAQIQFLLHFNGFTNAISMCHSLFGIFKYMGSRNGFGQVFAILDKILMIAIHGSRLKKSLTLTKKLSDTAADLSRSFEQYTTTSVSWFKISHDLEYSYPILRSAVFTLDVLHQLVQNLSYVKDASDETRKLLKEALHFSLSLQEICERMLTSTKMKPATQTGLRRHLVEIDIFSLRIIYYYITLFIQGKSVVVFVQTVIS